MVLGRCCRAVIEACSQAMANKDAELKEVKEKSLEVLPVTLKNKDMSLLSMARRKRSWTQRLSASKSLKRRPVNESSEEL